MSFARYNLTLNPEFAEVEGITRWFNPFFPLFAPKPEEEYGDLLAAAGYDLDLGGMPRVGILTRDWRGHRMIAWVILQGALLIVEGNA